MKNVPQTIWLNIGDQADDKDSNDFKELDEVTWSENKVGSSDVKYIREKIVKQRQTKQDQKDLDFLKELEERINRSTEDVTDLQYALQMVEDWKRELEKKLAK